MLRRREIGGEEKAALCSISFVLARRTGQFHNVNGASSVKSGIRAEVLFLGTT